jgi:hypothetical protein
MISITRHAKRRIKIRCGKSMDRLAEIAFNRGLTHAETTGSLNKYVTYVHMKNTEANNIRLYGDKIYIFCNEVLITVMEIPHKYRVLVKKLIDKRKILREDG